MTRRLGAAIGLIVVVVTIVWAIPTFAGQAFVRVGASVVLVDADDTGPTSLTIAGDGRTVGRARIDIRIENSYPLPVVVPFHGPAFVAEVRSRSTGDASAIWQAVAGDPELEASSDSVDEIPSAEVALVEPGTRVVTMRDPGTALELGADASAALFNDLRVVVRAYGLSSQAVDVSSTPVR